MAKTNQQIIVTEGDFGVEILTQIIDTDKKPVPIKGCSCKIKFEYNGNVISERTGIVIDELKGIVSVILDTEETQYSGLWTSYWICYDQFNNVTTTENIYYYVQPAIGSVNNPAFTELLNYYNRDEVNDIFKNILEQLNSYTLTKDDVEKYIKIYIQNKIDDDFVRQCILEAVGNGNDYVKKEQVEKINSQLTNEIETINSQQVKLTNDIETINSQLDNIETQIQDFINIDMFDNGNDITDTTRFINAFNYCKANNVRLQLNAKTYYINADTIEYDGSFSLQGVGKEKTAIVCNNEGDIFINTPKTTNIRNGIISNLSINGNYKCKIGLLFFGKKNIVRDCAIKNFTDYQIKLGDGEFRAWETEITKCVIQGCENDTNDTNKLPNTLVWYTLSATDNFMRDCVVTNCSDISIIDDGANNRFLNVHTFGYPDNHRQKTCFKLNGAYSSVIQCPLDTPKESGVIITGYNNNISLNSCFWNKEFQSTGSENFVVIDNTKGRCANNIISSNMTTYFGTNLSKIIKISGNDIGNMILNNSGNISNDNGNQIFLHPNNYLVINRDGTWYNSLGVNRDLLNVKTSLSLENSWIAFDGDEVFVRKNELGIPVLFGRISGGTEDNGTTIFTLPWQYRPTKYTSMQTMYRAKDDSYNVCEIGFSADGRVFLNGVSNCKYLLLNNVQILY